MNKPQLHVLSIDWDYFIDADYLTRNILFPDTCNENYSNELQSVIWSNLYANEPNLADIKTKKVEAAVTRKEILNQISNIETIMITDSHRYAFDLVHELYDTGKFDGLHILNIDFHHDIYDNSDEIVDCGNWLKHLILGIKSENNLFQWICQTDSSFDENDKVYQKLEISHDIRKIYEYKWDALFICRSGMWSPPHLDAQFLKLVKPIMQETKPIIRYQSHVLENRFDTEFLKAIHSIRTATKEIISNMTNNNQERVKE